MIGIRTVTRVARELRRDVSAAHERDPASRRSRSSRPGPACTPCSLFAVGVPKLAPDANPRRVVNAGFLLLFAGLVLLVSLLDIGAGPEIITGPLLLIGSGLGAMASQLGSVTVSAVPDEQSGEVGGIQNTGTQLGASIGTALAGAILISAVTASFFTNIENNSAIPDKLVANAQTQLATGVP